MNEIKRYINEFEWIIKVLDSCKTRSQALVSVELFKIFKKKWDNSGIKIENCLMNHSEQFIKRFETSWGTLKTIL